MNEVKKPKKPLIYYYFVVLLCVMLFNLLLMPRILERQIRETDYGTFMSMAEEQNIGRVQVQDNQILFTDKEGTAVYKTGLMYDPGLVDRLKDSGAIFSSEIIEETSPLLSVLLTWILPMVVFVVLGQFMSKKLMDRAGGGAGALLRPECPPRSAPPAAECRGNRPSKSGEPPDPRPPQNSPAPAETRLPETCRTHCGR